MRRIIPALIFGSFSFANAAAPKFRAQPIDTQLQIGYGLAVADIDGDKKPDIVVADSHEVAWYHNPDWAKHRISGALTAKDNVGLAAADIDGDGKAELAVGANWDPGDTQNSGAIFTFIAPDDRTTEWKPVEHTREPTAHRMQWVKPKEGAPYLAVLPLHGRGNANGEGVGVKFLGYRPGDKAPWETFVISDTFHVTHNFEIIDWDASTGFLVACKEGAQRLKQSGDTWTATPLTDKSCGEIRTGKLANGKRFIVTVEPFHGNAIVVNPESDGLWSGHRVVIDDTLNQAHALAVADLLGTGGPQIVAGWREKNAEGKTGLRLYAPNDPDGNAWTTHVITDDNSMACEDLKVADLNGDGKPDIVASGRATKNVVIYWNERE